MIHQQIKDDLDYSVKMRLPQKDFIKVIIGEFDRVGKQLTDDQCIAILKKMHKNAETLSNQTEMNYLKGYIPAQMTEEEIEVEVRNFIESGAQNIGMVMKAFNQNFKGLADNKVVSTIARKLLN